MAGPVTVQFWGGIGTIGGSLVVVAEAGHRVIFDFGLAHAPAATYYAAPLAPRPGAVLREYLALGWAPPLPDLYRRELLAGTGLAPGPAAGPAPAAVFISHLHLDHYALSGLVAPGIPVYMHPESLHMLRALQSQGAITPGLPRPYTACPWGVPVAVGPLRVTLLPVDHDIPGASGLMVETSAGAVVYTGDLRLHGLHPERVWEFCAHARSLRPRLLIIEGTRLEREPAPDPHPLTEAALPERVAAHLRACPGLALAVLYPRHTERLARLAGTAAAAGRTLALEASAAALYTRCGGPLAGLAVYLPAAVGAMDPAPAWLGEVLDAAAAAGAPVVDAAAVADSQDRWLLQLSYPHLGELVDLRPAPGSLCLHANGEPLGPYDPAWNCYQRWLQRFGVAHVPLGCSGHATPADLQRIAAAIAPAVVAPIHSLYPEGLELPGTPRLLPAYGETWRLDDPV